MSEAKKKMPPMSMTHVPGKGVSSFQRAYRKHGSTKPMKLEKRREGMTGKLAILEERFNNIRAYQKQNESAMGPDQKLMVEGMLADVAYQIASIEGTCLLIDCLTNREEFKSKSGKEGFVRYSAAFDLRNLEHDIHEVLRLLKEFVKEPPEEGGDDEEPDDEEIHDPENDA